MRLIRATRELSGRRVLVMGLGTKDGGLGAALFALRHGAEVTVTDRQDAGALREPLRRLDGLPVRFRLGGHDPADFAAAEIVLRNPGISRDHPLLRLAAENGAVVESPIGLFSEVVNPRTELIGITGTKGKSYTTHLTQHILASGGERAVAAGNNCVSPLRHLDAQTVVLELSSWQLRELGLHRRSPHVACWLNFFPDHLDHYDGDLGAYWADKLGITAHQRPDDWIVLPWSDHRLRDLATAARRSYFGATIDGPFEDGCHLRDGRIVLRRGGADRPVARLAELPTELRVPHHVELVLAATACAAAHGADPGLIGPALASFHGITHRFERIGAWRGIQFINDSAATTPESVALALRATARPTVLIFGGGGRKGLSYRHLAPVAARHAQTIVLFADDGPSVELARRLPPGTDTVTVVDMAQAVRAGAGALLRRGGGTLLLSSGCSGAPFYPDLFVRGETFRDCFRALVRGGAG